MRSIVLLASCLLVASATPVDLHHDYIEVSSGTDTEHGSDTDVNGDSPSATEVPIQDTEAHNSAGLDPQSELSESSPADSMDNTDGNNMNNNDGRNADNSDGNRMDNNDGQNIDDNDEQNTGNNEGQSPTSSVNTVSATSTKFEESTQETNGTFITPPPDDNPEDCRNASKPNHAFLQCTFLCEGDEMLTAPNHAVCFLNPDNGTIGKRITQMYNHTHHNASEMGVCFDGDCVSNSTGSPATTTESSPVPNTSANTPGETEISSSEPVSATDTTPSDVPVSSSQSPAQKISSAEKVDNQENPAVTPVGPEELEEVSSTTVNGPIALPAALPAMT